MRAEPEYPDNELGHFRHHPTYSMWSAMKYILSLSLVLWWLPTFGQMIAGYIGGRRAGGPWRGIAAAIVPVALIVALSWGSERGLLAPWLVTLTRLPNLIGGAVMWAVPPAEPYVRFVLAYMGTFVEALKSTLNMGQNGYLVTVVFSYIGGILADQARREARVGRGTSVGVSISQPIFAPFRHPVEAWEDRHAERFDDLRKIPVRSAAVAAAHAAPPARGKPHKVDAPRADAGAEEGARAAEEPKAKPERRELTAHDKEAATRRFVERALRQYEATHRR
ncbi:MAG TPA: hypothetical protein VGR51_10970 [Thermoplasmata archaeon]|nr:hypothetical protein [Thermoplasmata archaeon]